MIAFKLDVGHIRGKGCESGIKAGNVGVETSQFSFKLDYSLIFWGGYLQVIRKLKFGILTLSYVSDREVDRR